VLSIFLPQACNLNGLPAQCKASGAPLPAPGPAIFGSNVPSLPPTNGSPLSPQGNIIEFFFHTLLKILKKEV
ncbi:non-specific lipid-transfer protein, partial [Trifolium medium]|nr:non-specific lipid-transfer protein [Trifolium medium]